jgi:hypothetical protein
MSAVQTERPSLHIGQERLLAFVRTMLGVSTGREDDDHPLPPGPWDPVIRIALERAIALGPQPEHGRAFGMSARSPTLRFFPHPEPWQLALASLLARHPEAVDAIGGGHRFGDEVALNPQPLPPRYAFLVAVAQAVVDRAEILQDVANAVERQGIIIVGGYTSEFCDEWCGNGFRLKWPFPGPRPHWYTHELSGIDLVVMAATFDQAAKQTFSPGLRQSLANAGARLAEEGLSRMQTQ